MELDTVLPPFCSLVLLVSVALTWCITRRDKKVEYSGMRDLEEKKDESAENEIYKTDLENREKED